jgi:hypothetical protein
MRDRLRVAVLAMLVFALSLTACGSDRGGEPQRTVSRTDPPALYEVDATVLEDKPHAPMLCLGAVLLSLPPQCGDVPIVGWNWQTVEGEESARGTTWGLYHLVGRHDGKTFVLTETGPYEERGAVDEAAVDFATPCREPAGGWSGLDHATQEDARPALSYAESRPDYVTSWVTHLDRAKLEFGPVVVNAVFTTGRERHETAMRKVWDGPLCVIERGARTARELDEIRRDAEARLESLGMRMLWSSGPDVTPVIEIGIVADPGGEAQAALDERYGPGVVRLIPALKPSSADRRSKTPTAR